METPASTEGSFISPTLEDDKAITVETKPPKQEKQETVRANAARGSNAALMTMLITVCLISLAALLLTLLMLFGKIGYGCGCSTYEASSTDSARIKALEGNISSLRLGLIEHLDDFSKFNNCLIKTEAGYNALRDDLNTTRSELLLITDNKTLTTRLEYLDAGLTRLKSVLNRTGTDLAELKSTQMTKKVIYHQTMTPSWLAAHASYISIYRLNATEQLTFTAGQSEDNAALLKVPAIPANVLQNSTQLTVKIVVYNDVNIGTNEDSDITYGMSDGTSVVGFMTLDKANYMKSAPCFGIEGSPGTSVTIKRVISNSSPKPSASFFPGQFIITLKLGRYESWGSCYTAHDGGFAKTAVYNNRLVLNKGLTLEVYKEAKEERVGIKFIEVTVIEDL